MNYSLVKLIGDVVSAVNTELMPMLSQVTVTSDDGVVTNRGIENVNYFYGPIPLIVDKLVEWNKSETYEPKRYPLVALIQPFDEVSGKLTGVQSDITLDIAICMLSTQTADTPTRYAVNFYPILLPIYESLLRNLELDGRFEISDSGLIEHTKIEWPFWDAGKEKNPFNDKLDVVELKNLKLRVLTPNCQ